MIPATFPARLLAAILAVGLGVPLPAAEPTPLKVRLPRPTLAEKIREGFLVRSEPEPARVLAPPSLSVDFVAPPDSTGLELVVRSAQPADVEVQLIYQGETPFPLPRRTVEPLPGNAPTLLRWEVPRMDRLTSFTLALRGGDSAEVLRWRSWRAADVELAERLLTLSDQPLQLRNALKPLHEGVLGLDLIVPPELRPLLADGTLAVLLEDDAGQQEKLALAVPPLEAGAKARPHPRALVDVRPTRITRGRAKMALLLASAGRDVVLARQTVDLTPSLSPAFALEGRSVEGFRALVRKGELALYVEASEEFRQRGASGARLSVESIWLAVGNGAEWVHNAPLLRSRRDLRWLAGGPHSFAALEVGSSVYGYFSTTFANGEEGLCLAAAGNSLFLTPTPKNPIWKPAMRAPLGAPLWRGNAAFPYGTGALVLVGLEKPPGAPSSARLLAAAQPSMLADLGAIPLPGLDATATELSSFQEAGTFALLAGPKPQFFLSDHPVRGWRQGTVKVPAGVHALQLLRWNDRLWLFGLQDVNRRGVVRWWPAELQGDQLRAIEGEPFVPLPLATLPPPPPAAPARSETDVR